MLGFSVIDLRDDLRGHPKSHAVQKDIKIPINLDDKPTSLPL